MFNISQLSPGEWSLIGSLVTLLATAIFNRRKNSASAHKDEVDAVRNLVATIKEQSEQIKEQSRQINENGQQVSKLLKQTAAQNDEILQLRQENENLLAIQKDNEQAIRGLILMMQGKSGGNLKRLNSCPNKKKTRS